MVAAGVAGSRGSKHQWGQWCRCRPRPVEIVENTAADTARAVGNTDL